MPRDDPQPNPAIPTTASDAWLASGDAGTTGPAGTAGPAGTPNARDAAVRCGEYAAGAWHYPGVAPARRATALDAAEIIRLAQVMYAAMEITVGEVWRAAAVADVASRLGDDVVGYVVDLPGEPGRLAASGLGVIQRRLPGPVDLAGQVGYIQWVATDPQWRRRGFARAVMRSLVGWFDTRATRWIELHATREGEPLYRSLGFENPACPGLRRTFSR